MPQTDRSGEHRGPECCGTFHLELEKRTIPSAPRQCNWPYTDSTSCDLLLSHGSFVDSLSHRRTAKSVFGHQVVDRVEVLAYPTGHLWTHVPDYYSATSANDQAKNA